MRFMVLVKADDRSEAGVISTEAEFAEMGRFNERLADAGLMVSGDGLHPSSKGARIRFTGNGATVIDGPFAEAKELIAGFWMLKAGSLQEVLDWMRQAPFGDGAELEVRQVYDDADFGAELTPELREQEARIRAKSESEG